MLHSIIISRFAAYQRGRDQGSIMASVVWKTLFDVGRWLWLPAVIGLVGCAAMQPPAPAGAVLRRFSPPHLEETLLGDHEEMFALMAERHGRLRAGLWYWKQALQAILFSLFWGGIMFANYIKTALRHTKKNKSFSLINISGLALGIACCLLILMWIQDELSWDRFHENSGNIFRVVQRQQDGHLTPVTPDALAPHLEAEYPEVENAVRSRLLNKIQLQSAQTAQAENFGKLLVAMSEDIRVLLVKLADRLHNMRTLNFVKPEKRQRVARETMEI